MYRMPGAGGSSKSTINEKEEKKLARQSVWNSVYFFVGYVILLRLGRYLSKHECYPPVFSFYASIYFTSTNNFVHKCNFTGKYCIKPFIGKYLWVCTFKYKAFELGAVDMTITDDVVWLSRGPVQM